MQTLYKSKLSKHLSYPFGLETLSEQLASVPQADEISVRFSDVSELKSKATILGRHRILDCFYNPQDEHRWQMSVMPVTREARAGVRQLLIEHGIPRLRLWLETARSDFWLSDMHCFAVFYDASSGELAYEEPS
jgi:hypothetical protein